jgi:hypothetical protein
MQRVTRFIAFGAVLWHMLAGCCGHHAHAECPGDCHRQAEAVEDCCDHDHDCHAKRLDNSDDHHPAPLKPHHHPSDCHDGPCVFVLPEIGQAGNFCEVSPAIVGICPQESSVSGEVSMARPADLPPPVSGPPLRLHVLQQIFLI